MYLYRQISRYSTQPYFVSFSLLWRVVLGNHTSLCFENTWCRRKLAGRCVFVPCCRLHYDFELKNYNKNVVHEVLWVFLYVQWFAQWITAQEHFFYINYYFRKNYCYTFIPISFITVKQLMTNNTLSNIRVTLVKTNMIPNIKIKVCVFSFKWKILKNAFFTPQSVALSLCMFLCVYIFRWNLKSSFINKVWKTSIISPRIKRIQCTQNKL